MHGELRVCEDAVLRVAALGAHHVGFERLPEVHALAVRRVAVILGELHAARVAIAELVELAPNVHEGLPRVHPPPAPRDCGRGGGIVRRLRDHGIVGHVRVLRVADGEPLGQRLPLDRRRPLRVLRQEEHQLPVHHHLQLRGVDVVRVAAEGILDLPRDVVQAPEDEHLREGQGEGPPRLIDPLAQDEGGDQGVQDQQAVARLRIWEREGNGGKLERVVEMHQAGGELLEGPRENGRGDVHDACVDGLDDQLLDPLEDKLDLAIGGLEGPQASSVDALDVDELVLEGRLDADLVGIVLARVLDLSQGQGVEHAEQADQSVLEYVDLLILSFGEFAEGGERARRVEPVGPHHMAGRAAIPKPGVGL
mmetsp:Transcript_46425/g.135230  ORF Transcript_46425/g.135230 Transcript_46425/m.135230 type:complete len:365 (+) Transcript_46425:683-1777(+)